jgi:hypothetical protein
VLDLIEHHRRQAMVPIGSTGLAVEAAQARRIGGVRWHPVALRRLSQAIASGLNTWPRNGRKTEDPELLAHGELFRGRSVQHLVAHALVRVLFSFHLV